MHWNQQQWTIASLATGAASLVALLLAVSTAHWLYMSEFCSQTITEVINGTNITLEVNMTIYSNAGLWQICTYFANYPVTCEESGLSKGLENDRVEEQPRTGAVIEATRIQFPLTCMAVFLTLVGFVCSILGNFRQDRKTIVAAVMYICSGLCLSVSVILFISRINDELALQQSVNCVDFHYKYGWSFYLVGLSFVMEETSAVISIKLFLLRNFNKLDDMIRIIPGLEDKLCVDTTQLNTMEAHSQTLIW